MIKFPSMSNIHVYNHVQLRHFVMFVGPCPYMDMDYCIRSNFWKFYLIKISFTLGEPVSLVKVFRLFKWEHMFFGVQSVDTRGRCTTFYLIGRATVFLMPCFD